MKLDQEFWKEQRVFVTGHTGFKGSWLSLWLEQLGCEQFCVARPPETTPNLYDLIGSVKGRTSVIGEISDLELLKKAVSDFRPTLAIHMAAQPLVRRSYREPVETFATNVMGTVNVLEALRIAPELKCALVVTTDKVYKNDDSGRAFKEGDPLGGHDPYSSSKAACEEVVSCYRASFYEERGIPVLAARAGNVVGGGDWSEDRLIPDIWRALGMNQPVVIRNPESVRPWQHVLDPLSGYLSYLEAGAKRQNLHPALNFAPVPTVQLTVQQVTEILSKEFGKGEWVLGSEKKVKEMNLLTLDSSLAHASIGWSPKLTSLEAIEWTAKWYVAQDAGADSRTLCLGQIYQYLEL